jgi:hypothetical protein
MVPCRARILSTQRDCHPLIRCPSRDAGLPEFGRHDAGIDWRRPYVDEVGVRVTVM